MQEMRRCAAHECAKIYENFADHIYAKMTVFHLQILISLNDGFSQVVVLRHPLANCSA
jgi:hypothetical protein